MDVKTRMQGQGIFEGLLDLTVPTSVSAGQRLMNCECPDQIVSCPDQFFAKSTVRLDQRVVPVSMMEHEEYHVPSWRACSFMETGTNLTWTHKLAFRVLKIILGQPQVLTFLRERTKPSYEP